MSFLEGEIVILNEKAKKGLPSRIGERGVIIVIDESYSPNYDYVLEFDDGTRTPVHEKEIDRLTEEDKIAMEFIFTGSKVIFQPANEKVKIKKVDYINMKAEIEFLGGDSTVVGFGKLSDSIKVIPDKQPQIEALGKFTEIAFGIGEFTDIKNKQYGSSVDATHKMIQVLMERYTYDEDNYLIPKDLLKHLLLTVRVMDKQNRIFNNPSGKGDSESPWKDITGYGLIGVDMVENK